MNGLGLYLMFMIPPMLLALWAQWRVRSSYAAAAEVPAACGMTGAEITAEILRAHNIANVGIEMVPGQLSDHYDPRAKMLRLSPDVYHGRSVAALGIAAHEAGHAIQDAQRYAPLVLRNGIVPLAAVGSHASMFLIMAGMMLGAGVGIGLGKWLLIAGIAGFSLVVIFQLINLPVEFDASNRAKKMLQETGLVAQGGEARAMNRVLGAAAMTYVAATVGAISTLLYYVLIAMSGSRQQEN